MSTFTVQPGSSGHRIVNEHGRTVTSGITTWSAAQEMADLLNSGTKFRGRALVMDNVRRAQRKDDNNNVTTANGKTCNSPHKGVHTPVINSSKPRGY